MRNNRLQREPLNDLFEDAVKILIEHAKLKGPFLPWHESFDPYEWLVAESILRLTTRKAASKAFLNLINSYPNWNALYSASEEDIIEKISSSGLQKQKAHLLKSLAINVIEELRGEVPCTPESLLKLPGVGNYVSDAILLYVCKMKVFPLDGNVQRVVRRLLGKPISLGTRRTDPYCDILLKQATERIIEESTYFELVYIHRGILDIAWTACRFYPRTSICPLRNVCRNALTHSYGEH